MSLSGFVVPAEKRAMIEEAFPRSKDKRLLGLELMNWGHYPSSAEINGLADKYEHKRRWVQKTIEALQELNLFTEADGSIPLLEYTLRMEQEKKLPLSAPSAKTKPSVERVPYSPDVSEDELTDEEDDVEETEIGTLEDEVARMGRRLEGTEAQLQQLGKHMKEQMEMMTRISAQFTQGLSASNPDETAPPAPEPAQEIVETPPPSPLAGLTGDQVIELARNQPQQFLELVNPRAPRTLEGDRLESYVEAPPETVRKMIVEVTTYTQMLYEKAKADGGFDGTFSDFLNWAPAKYFEDRGLALGWHRIEAARRGRLG